MPIFSYSGNLLEGQSQNVVKKKISFSRPVRVLKCVIYVLLLKLVKINQLVNVISNQSSSEINRSSFVLKKKQNSHNSSEMFTSCKAEQPLRGTELQEKEAHKD